MSEFNYIKNPQMGNWVISAPRRAKKPTLLEGGQVCPFCPGHETNNEELYRVGGKKGDAHWKLLVMHNKYPFTPHHEVIIHSPDHQHTIDSLPFSQVQLLLETYRDRSLVHKDKGLVYIFHNSGKAAGESVGHPHSQLTVIVEELAATIPMLPALPIYPHGHNVFGSVQHKGFFQARFKRKLQQVFEDRSYPAELLYTDYFSIFCPATAAWPDEVWIAPKREQTFYYEITAEEIIDLAFCLARIIQLFNLRHGEDFPYNYYIYPGINWYVRLIPRMKTLGGFEIGTGVMVNTQLPQKTMAFIREHFWRPDREKIQTTGQAEYAKRV